MAAAAGAAAGSRPPMREGCDPAQSGFLQDQPKLGNQYEEDSVLRSIMSRYVPAKELKEMTPDLVSFGDRVWYELKAHAREQEERQPVLKQYDAFGRRVDELMVSAGWKHQKTVSATEGLISIGYERKHAQYSRIHQYAKLYLYTPSSGLYGCPLAMTDGAARLIEVISDRSVKPLLAPAYEHLVSRVPAQFWTSGQWMTERKGGSDVANGTETIAVPQPDGTYRLWGYKWFTSASDSEMTITLARIQQPDGSVVSGTQGLSLFYVELRDSEGMLQGIEVAKLKNKLGTKQLPTAEMKLIGTPARLISAPGGGVKLIAANMINITRLHNATNACGFMRRVIALARDYTHRRSVFGKKLSLHPLHLSTLAALEVEYRAAMQMTFYAVALMGRDECKAASADDVLLLRLLTPVVKLYTGKQVMSVVSEGLECFGGNGYIEDTGLPGILRDAQVLPIWEGTTNVLSMDVLRVMAHTKGKAFHAFVRFVQQRINTAKADPKVAAELHATTEAIKSALNTLVAFAGEHLASAATGGSDALQVRARDFSLTLARICAAALLVEHAVWSGAHTDVVAAEFWALKAAPLVLPALTTTPANAAKDAADRARVLALDLTPSGLPQGCGEVSPGGKPRARL